MGKRRKIGICTYCGDFGSVTSDHIPPQTIFAKPRPNNLITVPCCEACREPTTQDDEYFRIRVGLNDKARPHPDVKANLDSIFRSLHRPEAEGMKRRLLADTFPVPVTTSSGIYVGQHLAFNVDTVRVFRVVERIVRGLYFHETHERIPEGYAVRVFSNETLSTMSPQDLQRTTNEIIAPLARVPPKIIGAQTFMYRPGLTAQPFVSAWSLTFYAEVPFLAVTLPHGGGSPPRLMDTRAASGT